MLWCLPCLVCLVCYLLLIKNNEKKFTEKITLGTKSCNKYGNVDGKGINRDERGENEEKLRQYVKIWRKGFYDLMEITSGLFMK